MGCVEKKIALFEIGVVFDSAYSAANSVNNELFSMRGELCPARLLRKKITHGR